MFNLKNVINKVKDKLLKKHIQKTYTANIKKQQESVKNVETKPVEIIAKKLKLKLDLSNKRKCFLNKVEKRRRKKELGNITKRKERGLS